MVNGRKICLLVSKIILQLLQICTFHEKSENYVYVGKSNMHCKNKIHQNSTTYAHLEL